MELESKVEEFKRGLLNEALLQCTKEQQEFFHRIYPSGVPEKALANAIDLCNRTIKKNNAKEFLKHIGGGTADELEFIADLCARNEKM